MRKVWSALNSAFLCVCSFFKTTGLSPLALTKANFDTDFNGEKEATFSIEGHFFVWLQSLQPEPIVNYKAICAQIRSTPTGLASCSAFFNEVTTVIATTVQCHSNNCKGLVSVLLKVSGGGRERQVSPTWLPPSQVHTPPNPNTYFSALCK